ncbi:MAG: hypothetical protein Q4E77_05635 [Conchiformibius sp.]|nr:hypothetical protein [Conchiformibius sp.]
MKRLLYIAALGLSACAVRPPADRPVLPENQVCWFQAERLASDGGTVQTALLSIQGESGDRTRWLLADAFGAPQARLLLSAQGWQRDGFAPPNRAAQQLFNKLIPLLKKGFSQPETVEAATEVWQISPLEPYCPPAVKEQP